MTTGGIITRHKGKFEASRPASGRRASSRQDSYAPAKTPKKKKASGSKVPVVLACIAVVALLAVCGYGFYLKNTDSIFPNVYVAGVNVGGLKRDAAINAVESAMQTTSEGGSLTVILPDRTVTFSPDLNQIASDPEAAADAAMAYGRDGGPISTIFKYKKAKKTEYNVSLNADVSLDTAYIQDLISETAIACESDAIDPIVTVDEDENQIEVITGSPAIHLDQDALYDAVVARFESGDLSDLTFDYETQPCASLDLQKYYDQYCKEMQDAYYDEETKELVEEVPGFGFDVTFYSQKVAMADPGTTVTIQMEPMEPEVTLEELKEIYFADTLASCDTAHTWDTNRTTNLTLACKAIDGTILNPGEEFSFNKVVGERTTDKGYKAAIVYTTGGVSEPDTGGGVCQVASTIYTSCLLADLEVTKREPHMYLVTYVKPGMDATIYWPNTDFAFKNSTEYPLRIDASVSDGYVHVKLIGTQPEKDYDHINLRGEYVSTKSYKNVISDPDVADEKQTEITIVKGGGTENGKTVDLGVDAQGKKYVLESVVNTPYTGYTVKAYRDFVDASGNVIRTELLHTDVFRSRNQSYKVHEYVEPVVEPEPEPDPDESDTSITDFDDDFWS